MQRRRDWLVIAGAVLGCVGLGQPEITCPAIAGASGQVVRIGDWTLVPQVGLVTCSDGAALTVACAGHGDDLEVRLLFPHLASGTTTLRIRTASGAVLAAARTADTGGAIVLRGVEAEAVAALLATGEALRFTVTPDADDAPAPVALFATAGFEEALPWLGCGAADACPSRSCGR
jgi:hypothetical protein